MLRFSTLITLILLSSIEPVSAETVRIAVASNFLSTLQQLKPGFEKTGHKLQLSSGSTGKLYAQIIHGAPYDIFLAADQKRPALLVQKKRAEGLTHFASGRIVLWSNKPGGSCLERLQQGQFKKLAIANAKTAPYGKAAQQFLAKRGLLSTVRPKLVQGENISQTMQFAMSGLADLGVLALSQVRDARTPKGGCEYPVPESDYDELAQYGVIVSHSTKKRAALDFFNYLESGEAQKILQEAGYSVRK